MRAARHHHGATQQLGCEKPRPHTRATSSRIQQGVQRAARNALAATSGPMEARMWNKLERWQILLFPRLPALRAMQVTPRLRSLVPPGSCAAVVCSWFNGWSTWRRFQAQGPCLWGCLNGEESVEHYSFCRKVRELGQQLLGLPLPHVDPRVRRHTFVLLDGQAALPDAMLARGALLVGATYRLHWKAAVQLGPGAADSDKAVAARNLPGPP